VPRAVANERLEHKDAPWEDRTRRLLTTWVILQLDPPPCAVLELLADPVAEKVLPDGGGSAGVELTGENFLLDEYEDMAGVSLSGPTTAPL